jgi:hypothetical protein
MTIGALSMIVRPTLRYLLPIILFFFCNPLPGDREKIADSNVLSPPSAYAAEEPEFIKEGKLAFLEKNSKKLIITIDIEIADNDFERTRGLMYRHSLPENAGMLFIFEKSGPLSFWMRNTYIRLDIIFADEKKQIVSIQKKTEPLSYTAIQSTKKAKYVVEVNAGFCDRHGIKVGDWITF